MTHSPPMHRSPSKQQRATLLRDSAERKALALENDMPTRRVTRSQSRELEDYSGRVRSGQYGGGDGRKMGKGGDGDGELCLLLFIFSCWTLSGKS